MFGGFIKLKQNCSTYSIYVSDYHYFRVLKLDSLKKMESFAGNLALTTYAKQLITESQWDKSAIRSVKGMSYPPGARPSVTVDETCCWN